MDGLRKELVRSPAVTACLAGYEAMCAAREIDRVEQRLVDQGAAFFSVSGAGHEASAALAPLLGPEDWVHCHYRDKALMLARGLPPEEFFRGLFCKETSGSRGRQMSAHPACKALNLLSIPGPVGNHVLQDVGVAAALRERDPSALVVCAMGEGTTQQGEVLEGICEAARGRLPMLFLIHDNRLAISTRTAGRTVFSGGDESVLGVPVRRVDGLDYAACAEAFTAAVAEVRSRTGPVAVVMSCERLSNHTNADDQAAYRSPEELARAAERDPIPRLRTWLLERGVTPDELAMLEDQVRARVRSAARTVFKDPPGEPVTRVLPEFRSDGPTVSAPGAASGRLTMVAAMNRALAHYLKADERVYLYGQDIEEPKGDVFGVTKGLSDGFPGRVVNAPLAEATILGSCIGRAMAGQKPVAFIQFADFLPLALNQVVSELSTLAWRTDGQFTVPLVAILSAGGYRPGLGPFHAQTMEAYLCHTPGIVVVSPSNAADAAGLLVSAMEAPCPVFLIYPKSLLNAPEAAATFTGDIPAVPFGQCAVTVEGDDITLVGWGNMMPRLAGVAGTLATAGVTAEVIDLRSLMPWDKRGVLESAARTGRLLVAHEDNESCGLAAEIVATVATAPEGGRVRARRVCRPDVPIPCSFPAQLRTLPSEETILEAACELMEITLRWEVPRATDGGRLYEIKATGTSPADSQLQLLGWRAKPGDRIEEGDALVEIEADKAVFDFVSPVTGRIVEQVVPSFTECSVGDCIARVEPAEEGAAMVAPTELPKRIARLRRRTASDESIPPPVAGRGCWIHGLETGVGTREVENGEIAAGSGMTEEEIIATTGISRRHWFGSEEEMEQAVTDCLDRMLATAPRVAARLGLLLVSSATNRRPMPSRACRLLAGLSRKHALDNPAASDFQTACSGYIYGLEHARGYLALNPDRCVLLVTSEALSACLDKRDRNTAALFGDGYSVTLIAGDRSDIGLAPLFKVRSTCCFAEPDDEGNLSLEQGGCVHLDGGPIFRKAVRAMPAALESACAAADIGVANLDIVVPHQANQRIIDAVRRRLNAPELEVFSNIRDLGNTSSTTIPLALREILDSDRPNPPGLFGLTAFGGGYTYAGAVLERFEGEGGTDAS